MEVSPKCHVLKKVDTLIVVIRAVGMWETRRVFHIWECKLNCVSFNFLIFTGSGKTEIGSAGEQPIKG